MGYQMKLLILYTCEAVGDQAKAHQKKSDKSDSLNSAAVHQEDQVDCST